MSYESIIVLAAVKRNGKGKYPNFKNGTYIGAQVRMDAAAKLAQKYPDNEVLLVGGKTSLIEDMFDFISSKSPDSRLKSLCSLPCTYHNIVRAIDYWYENGLPGKVGVLTNACHLPRTFAFIKLIQESNIELRNIEFIPISAEEVLAVDINTIVKNRIDEYHRRLNLEARGVNMIKDGTYFDSCTNKKLISGIEAAKDQPAAISN